MSRFYRLYMTIFTAFTPEIRPQAPDTEGATAEAMIFPSGGEVPTVVFEIQRATAISELSKQHARRTQQALKVQSGTSSLRTTHMCMDAEANADVFKSFYRESICGSAIACFLEY